MAWVDALVPVASMASAGLRRLDAVHGALDAVDLVGVASMDSMVGVAVALRLFLGAYMDLVR